MRLPVQPRHRREPPRRGVLGRRATTRNASEGAGDRAATRRRGGGAGALMREEARLLGARQALAQAASATPAPAPRAYSSRPDRCGAPSFSACTRNARPRCTRPPSLGGGAGGAGAGTRRAPSRRPLPANRSVRPAAGPSARRSSPPPHCSRAARRPPPGPRPTPPMPPNPSAAIAARAADLVGRMALDEKIGQMTQVDRDCPRRPGPGDVPRSARCLSGGGSAPDSDNSASGWADMFDALPARGALTTPLGHPDHLRRRRRARARQRRTARRSSRTTSASAPPATRQLVERDRRVDGRRGGRHRHRLDFAPVRRGGCATTAGAAHTSRSARSRMPDGDDVRSSTGYQDRGVLATAKHFLATAAPPTATTRATCGSAKPTCAPSTCPRIAAAIERGVGSVMVSFSSWNGPEVTRRRVPPHRCAQGRAGASPASSSPDWAGTGRRLELGTPDQRSLAACVNAGADVVHAAARFVLPMTVYLEHAARGGERRPTIPLARLDDAGRRILTTKLRAGPLRAAAGSPTARLTGQASALPAHRDRGAPRRARDRSSC